ncbi:hypothetical protein D030_4532 [Vibrio parahaemolyticus AQ3810]|nr:hypothetical protein D046_6168 [Vibrio parahaemolyticus V-223/04]EWM35434.1 hypothetical protein D043_4358 [Vibrio parahaemolyticus EKP-021]EXF67636.1 hypothetical protein D030_4532 [Vibrio parahaemolyticus AQ3810]
MGQKKSKKHKIGKSRKNVLILTTNKRLLTIFPSMLIKIRDPDVNQQSFKEKL